MPQRRRLALMAQRKKHAGDTVMHIYARSRGYNAHFAVQSRVAPYFAATAVGIWLHMHNAVGRLYQSGKFIEAIVPEMQYARFCKARTGVYCRRRAYSRFVAYVEQLIDG